MMRSGNTLNKLRSGKQYKTGAFSRSIGKDQKDKSALAAPNLQKQKRKVVLKADQSDINAQIFKETKEYQNALGKIEGDVVMEGEVASDAPWFDQVSGQDAIRLRVTQDQIDRIRSVTGVQGGKASQQEYFNPIIPKHFQVTKYKTYQCQLSSNPSTFTQFQVFRLSFNVTNTDATEVPPQLQILPPAQGDGTSITFDKIKSVVQSSAAVTHDAIISALPTIFNGKKLAAIIVTTDTYKAVEELTFTSATKAETKKKFKVNVQKGPTLAGQIGDNLFLSAVKLLHQLYHCHGDAFRSDEALANIWNNLTFTIGTMDPTLLKSRNQAYMAGQQWYDQRAYIKINEQTKMVGKPATIETKQILGTKLTPMPEIVLPTFYNIAYNVSAAEKHRAMVSKFQGGSDTYLMRMLENRVLGLEPEARSIQRFANLESYETASLRWSLKRTGSSGKNQLGNYITKETYDEIKKSLTAEVESVRAKRGGHVFAVEWPFVKIPSFSFLDSVDICYISWKQVTEQQLRSVGTSLSNPASANLRVSLDSLASVVNSVSINYSIISRYVLKRQVMTPVLDRVQFTKNLKSKYYVLEALRATPVLSVGDFSWHQRSIGLLLRKKKRAILKAIVNQSKLDYSKVTYPYVQQALYWFKIFDQSSMNLRRMIGMATMHGITHNYDQVDKFDQCPWFEPFRRTREPRYKLLKSDDASVSLDQWHEAYNYLAESGIRTKTRKRLQKMFAAMKRNVRIAALLEQKQGLEHQKHVVEFMRSHNPTASMLMAFFLGATIGSVPAYHTRDNASRGYTGIHKFATNWFSEIIEGGDILQVQPLDQTRLDIQAKFWVAFKNRPINIGVSGGAPVTWTFDKLDAQTPEAQALLEELFIFVQQYYPGVSTVVQNSMGNDEPILKQIDRTEPNPTLAKLKVYLVLAMFFELIETGFLLLQNFNTAYFKHISDKSYSVMVYAWFKWTAGMVNDDWITGLSLSGGPVKSSLTKVQNSLFFICDYAANSLRRMTRPDRVSSKTDKQDDQWQIFNTLIDVYGDEALLGSELAPSSVLRKDLMSAKRADGINMDALQGADNSNAFRYLNDIQETARLSYRLDMGNTTQMGKKSKIVAKLNAEETARLNAATQGQNGMFNLNPQVQVVGQGPNAQVIVPPRNQGQQQQQLSSSLQGQIDSNAPPRQGV